LAAPGTATPQLTRRRALLAAGTLLLVLVVFALARFAPAAPQQAAETAAASQEPDPGATPAGTAAAADGGDPADAGGDDAVSAGGPPAAEGATARGGALFEFPAITDGVPRVGKPPAVRGIYLNAWAAGSPRRLAQLIELANRTEINTFVIDVKEGGEISYPSRVPLAREIGADKAHIGDVRAVLRKLRENGIYPIARIVVFRDAVLAGARPDWAVQHVNGGEWIDSYGHRWVDSYNRAVWDYNIAIAREALELGFSEVQWDYVRFPDVPGSLMRLAEWPARDGRTKAQGIREFLLYSREQLRGYDVPVTADVFGLTTSVRDDMGIGQLWEKMADATDVLLPMVYPSHYARGSYGIAQPNAAPFEIVRTAMQHAVRRNSGIEGAAAIRPWLQDFTLGQPRYGPAEVRAQIEAVYAAGLTEWVLWHPGSRYTVEALASADGRAPVFERPAPPAADSAGGPREAVPGPRRPLGSPVGAGTPAVPR
jgi:hypothetical protein